MSAILEVSTVGRGKFLLFLYGQGLNSGVCRPLIDMLKVSFVLSLLICRVMSRIPNSYSYLNDLQNITKIVAQHLAVNCILIDWLLGSLVAQKTDNTYAENRSTCIDLFQFNVSQRCTLAPNRSKSAQISSLIIQRQT